MFYKCQENRTLLEQQTYSKLGIGTTNLIQPAIQKVTPQIQSTVTVALVLKKVYKLHLV